MASLPVEQQAAIAWGVPRGRLAHAPEVGHDFLTIPRLNEAGVRAEIQRLVPLASPIDKLIADGEIEILSIQSQHPKRTESRIVVHYRLRGSSATQVFDSDHVGEVAAEPLPNGPSPDALVVHVLDNAAGPSSVGSPAHNVGTKIWSYSFEQVGEYGYDGPPARTIHLQAGFAGRGHTIHLLPSGHILVVTSELQTDLNNGGEAWFIVPADASGTVGPDVCQKIRVDELFAGTPYETYGARHGFSFTDGSVLLGSNGVWKQFTLAQLLDLDSVDYSTLPMWSYNGNGSVSGIGHYDVVPIPGTRKLVVQGHDRFWQIDLGLSPGVIDGTDVPGGDGLDWIALGNNIGRPQGEDWGGAIARDASGGFWKQRALTEDIAYWSAGVIATLPKLGGTAQANPVPTRTMTADVITALDPNVHGMYLGLDIEADGSLWNMTTIWDPQASPNARAMLMRFSAESCATGGVQVPDRLLYLPAVQRGLSLRVDPQFRLQAR
jgi:hypothetical protein